MASTLPELPGQIESGPSHSYNVLNYTLNVNIYNCFFSPFPHSFNATEIIRFKVDSTLNSIILNANSTSLQINSVSLAGISFTHANDLLIIQLNQTYNPGDTVEIGINYHHNNLDDNAFYAKNGFVFTDCEPEGARKWFPCWDKPSDKATLDLTAKVPGNVKLGSNGILADSVQSADTVWYHWVSEHNIATYLVVLTGKVGYNLDIVYWHKLTNPSDSIPIRFYYNNGEDPSTIEEIILPMADWYSENFCEHPFQKDGFATLNDDFTWGGMENQTLTSLCPGCWSESLTAHEFAHQWFGDMVTCGTWADIWLNEGFATWTEAFWYESYGGYAAYKADIDGNATYYLNNNPGWAISEPEWAITTPPLWILFNYAITYTKGSTILHMLRYVLGDSLFFATLQAYSTDPDLKYHSAVIPDFMAVTNQVTGANYDWFFNQWIYEPNHPSYANTYMYTNLGGGDWQVDFNARQVQADPPFFKMPLEIKIRFVDNSDTIMREMNSYNNQLYKWIFPKQPVAVTFDPFNQIVIKEGYTIVGTDDTFHGETLVLGQNSPNPASRTTSIKYRINAPSFVTITIRDIVGCEVMTLVNTDMPVGSYTISLDCSRLKPGIYFYTLTAGANRITKKMVVSN
ncbi:MAG: M1 family aminopeptidase [bacterium]